MSSLTRMVFCAVFLICMACNQQSKELPNPNDFTNYIVSYGPENLQKSGSIEIVLKQKGLVDNAKDLVEQAFQIKPQLNGALSFENEIIIFNPSEALKEGVEYIVSLDLKVLYADASAGVFKFKTMVIPQQYAIIVQDTRINDQGAWEIEALISNSDILDMDELKSNISINLDGKNVAFELKPDSPQTAILFIPSIQRPEKASKLSIQLKGQQKTVEKTVNIPSKDEFVLMYSQFDQTSNAVEFVFSQVLSQDQNLKGLIQSSNEQEYQYDKSSNKLKVYVQEKDLNETLTLTLSPALKSNNGRVIGNSIQYTVDGYGLKPELRMLGLGNIVPLNEKVVFPFQAKGLESVQMQLLKIYPDNLMQFWQEQSFDYAYNLQYVGNVVREETIQLKDLFSTFNPDIMMNYYVNLAELFKLDPNAMYQIKIGFTPKDAAKTCAKNIEYFPELDNKSIFNRGYYGLADYSGNFNWKDRDDPCKLAYYNDSRYIEKIFQANNIMIIAKKGNNGKLFVAAMDLATASPLTGARVELFDLAQQPMINGATDSEGFIVLSPTEDPFMVKVEHGGYFNVLNIRNGQSLSMTNFNVNGRSKSDGLDGFIYGERAIWRPGDDMFLNFILLDEKNKIPQEHPIIVSLMNPQGQQVYFEKISNRVGPIYEFVIPTNEDWLTGDYYLQVKLGSSEFGKNLLIEAIKPNNLSITSDLEFQEIVSNQKNITADFQINYLHGTPAKNVDFDIELEIREATTKFDAFPNYTFSNPRNNFNPPTPSIVNESKSNENGKASVSFPIPKLTNPSGKLKLIFKNTATEPSGDFSTGIFSIPYSPFPYYAGVEVKKNEYGSSRFDINKEVQFPIVLMDEKGNPTPNQSATVKIYKLRNYWWWNAYNDEFVQNTKGIHLTENEFAKKTRSDGKVEVKTTIQSAGRYFIEVCADNGKHCAGEYFYAGSPWDQEVADMDEYKRAAQLTFNSVLSSYKIGETVELQVPSMFQGKALVSIEDGDEVVEYFWAEVKPGVNAIRFTAQESMFPTAYANVTLVQAHENKQENMPLRMYGVIPITITDSQLELDPIIKTKDVFKPNETVSFEIKENKGKEMYYTLAIVEEGLMSLTNFKTPDPFQHFYQKSALGVRSFDMYDYVMSPYGKGMDKLYAIGGDGDLATLNPEAKANRFEPVVFHLGPFKLDKKKSNQHEITLPNYIGTVRVMLVAAKGNAFGSAEKSVPVKQDLMVKATLPRSLTPGDKLDIPVNTFVMNEKIKNVDLKIEESSGKTTIDQQNKSVVFDAMGEELSYFDMTVGNELGIANFDFSAKSGTYNSSQQIEIDVINPNPIERVQEVKWIKPGESAQFDIKPVGVYENQATVSVSSALPVNLESMIAELRRYPYGCLEQRLSTAMALLASQDLTVNSVPSSPSNQEIIQELVRDLWKFKHTTYGYSVWPGYRYVDEWLSSYVGHFLAVAKNNGYQVSSNSIDTWAKEQLAMAKTWKTVQNADANFAYQSDVLNQAYRLYTLALVGKTSLSEMNRLREDFKHNQSSALMLAAAYSTAGRSDIANEIVNQSSGIEINYTEIGLTYGSEVRDLAMQVLVFNKLKNTEKAGKSMQNLAQVLSKRRYLSTQDKAWLFLALKELNIQNSGKDRQFVWKLDNTAEKTITGNNVSHEIQLDMEKAHVAVVKNTSYNPMYVSAISSGQKNPGQELAAADNLTIQRSFKSLDGQKIAAESIALGTDFIIELTISRKSIQSSRYDQMALTQTMPAGWEIINNRMFGDKKSNYDQLDYFDIRDRDFYAFFDLQNQNSITIPIQVRSTYSGEYYFPATQCEAMYDGDIYALNKGFKTKVTR